MCSGSIHAVMACYCPIIASLTKCVCDRRRLCLGRSLTFVRPCLGWSLTFVRPCPGRSLTSRLCLGRSLTSRLCLGRSLTSVFVFILVHPLFQLWSEVPNEALKCEIKYKFHGCSQWKINVKHILVRLSWNKWRETMHVICDTKVPVKLKV